MHKKQQCSPRAFSEILEREKTLIIHVRYGRGVVSQMLNGDIFMK